MPVRTMAQWETVKSKHSDWLFSVGSNFFLIPYLFEPIQSTGDEKKVHITVYRAIRTVLPEAGLRIAAGIKTGIGALGTDN